MTEISNYWRVTSRSVIATRDKWCARRSISVNPWLPRLKCQPEIVHVGPPNGTRHENPETSYNSNSWFTAPDAFSSHWLALIV